MNTTIRFFLAAVLVMAIVMVCGCGQGLTPVDTGSGDDVLQPDAGPDDSGFPGDAADAVDSGDPGDPGDLEVGPDVVQPGPLVCNPFPIDFGEIELGQPRFIDVVVTNVGQAPLTVSDIYFSLNDSQDFALINVVSPGAPSPVTELANGEHILVSLRFTPTIVGPRNPSLVFVGTLQGNDETWSCAITGTGIGSRVDSAPERLDFGQVPVGETVQQTISVTNGGNADLEITAVRVALVTSGSFEIVDAPAAGNPIVVAPGGQDQIDVRWTPDCRIPSEPGSAIGIVIIESNEFADGPVQIPVVGIPGTALIEPIPATVDIGFGAPWIPKFAMLTIRNSGTAPLTIESLEMVNTQDPAVGAQFAVVADPAFPVTDPVNPVPSVIPPGGFQSVELTFTNSGPVEGQAAATLVIKSNSCESAKLEVPLIARYSPSPWCRAQLVPAVLNFGQLAMGFPETREVRLINTGTGACTITDFKLADCSLEATGEFTCPDALAGADSGYFAFEQAPSTTPGSLGPGKQTSLRVTYTPPTANLDFFNSEGLNYGLLSLAFSDASNDDEFVIPECSGPCQPNILASALPATAFISPAGIDFGTVTAGCQGEVQRLCITNAGLGPLKVTGIEMQGCSDEFGMVYPPAFPATVPAAYPVCVYFSYKPVNNGVDSCAIHVSTNDLDGPVFAVPMSGRATNQDSMVDEFVMTESEPVDILFVIDDSSSMCQEQELLISAFGGFIGLADAVGVDYQIGVISVNVLDGLVKGRLNRGDKSILPRYIVSGGDAAAEFARIADLGCDGGSDEREAGLEAMRAAFGATLTADTGVECDDDIDCAGNALICPAGSVCPYSCIDGTCAGFNSGFIRKQAMLHVIILSDESDHSVGYAFDYVNFLLSFKGDEDYRRVRVHSIVGVFDGSATRSSGGCVGADGDTASQGEGYIEASTFAEGVVGSICESSYASVLSEIAESAFIPRYSLRLSRDIGQDAPWLTVDNQGDGNGVPCTDGWVHEMTGNAIMLVDGACGAIPGDHIRVSYDMQCLVD